MTVPDSAADADPAGAGAGADPAGAGAGAAGGPDGDTPDEAVARLDRMMVQRGPLLVKMGLEWLEAGPDRVVARIPIADNAQPWGFLHGGASAVLAESIASAGAWLQDNSKIALGVDIIVKHLRSVKDGWVTGVGIPLQTGKGLTVWEIRITDDGGRLTAFSTCTVALRDPR